MGRFNVMGARAWPMVIGLGLTACGSDKKSESTPTASVCVAAKDTAAATTCSGSDCKVGNGFVSKASNGKISIDFTGVEAGAQYVLMPYLLGSVEGAAGSTPKFTFTAKAGAGASLNFMKPAQAPEFDAATELRTLDHDRRTLLNRFDPALGVDQGKDFWAIARSIDQRTATHSALVRSAGQKEATVEGFYRRAANGARFRKKAHALLTTATGGCPTTELTVPNEALDGSETDNITADKVVDGGDYCLVYVSTPTTVADKAAIESTVKTVLKEYKETIYKNALAPSSGFTFKPVVAVIDFSDETVWPQNPKVLKIAGAYIASMASETKQPMIYMAADFDKLAAFKGTDPAVAKSLWHSTIAHEMQHAIMDYFRTYVNNPKNPENTAVDEGIAHFMEDAWGYGTENFSGFPKKFLETWVFGGTPFLESGDDASQFRGAAQTLMFYLASQKGGVQFNKGRACGGNGMDFVSSVVTNSSGVGAQGIAAKFGGDWTETLGNYLASLATDGAITDGLEKRYQTQGPVKEVTDLSGSAAKTFGMHFNNFGDLKTAIDDIQADAKLGTTATAELTYYQTKPLLYTAAAGDTKVVFSLPDGTAGADLETAAVSAVRVK